MSPGRLGRRAVGQTLGCVSKAIFSPCWPLPPGCQALLPDSALLLALSGPQLQDSGSEGSRLRWVAWEARMLLRLCPTGSCTHDPWTLCPTHPSEVEGGCPVHGLGFVDTPAAQQAGPASSLCLSRPRTGSGEGPPPQTLACTGTPSSGFCAWGWGGRLQAGPQDPWRYRTAG